MEKKNNKLLKLLGLGFGVAVTVGGTIGTGILRKPGAIAEVIGDPFIIMLVWLAVCVYAFLGVLCAIELGVSMPEAGSWYVYAKRAFGSFFGFFTGISNWLGTVTALGFGAYTVSEYVVLLYPNAEYYIRAIAIGLIVVLVLFHLSGTKSAGKSQEVMSFLKALGLFAFVLVCFVYGGDVDHQALTATARKVERPALFFGIIVALQAIFYTFDGWHTAAYFAEENVDPVKSLPKSMIYGILLIIAIYLLVNAAILYVIPIDLLAGSKLAASDAIGYIFGEGSARIVTFFLMISILGLMNAQVMFSPRVIFSMSRDGLFPAFAQKVNTAGTPYLGMIFTASLSIGLILLGKEVCAILSDIAVFFFVISYISGFSSLIRLRKTEPNLARPFKVPGYPYIPYLLVVCSVLFLVGAVVQDLLSSVFALVFIVVSYPLYRLIRNVSQQ
jgi:APA family basic amino acid/polyamine antiporter